MVMEFFHGGVFVTVVENRAVIRTEDDHGVFLQPLLFHDSDNFADRPVELYDGITAETRAGFTLEALMRYAWHVQIV